MTTLILQAAGSAVGSLVGGPFGAAIGRSLGSAFGHAIDRALFFGGGSSTTREGPRLTEMGGLASTEGVSIPRVYGRARLGGTLIWATRFLEQVDVQDSGGGKGGGGGSGSSTRTYSYTANLAIGLCEGPIAYVRRIWANGKELDWSSLTFRLYHGTETQEADPLIVAKEGAENAPAYRGLAYLVFEGLPLADFGNRVPQFSFEVVRPVDGVRQQVQAINLIPGAGEFVYDTQSVTTSDSAGTTLHLNRHQLAATSDVVAALDQLQALCPALKTVQLVVSWFGDDLRAGRCSIAPRVDALSKSTLETEWRVSGLRRADARLVTMIDGAAAYGGTPSDASVLRVIKELKARGLKVTLYPFVMMDIGPDSALPDPHAPGSTQPPFPWRGRITCDPAPGLPGSPNGTSQAAVQLSKFFGQATPQHFAPQGETVTYAGPIEWSWRRMVLHYATLAKVAGGVDGFIIGSELRDLTQIENAPGRFPAIDALVALAADVKTILGSSTAVTYAADWTEYGARHVSSGAVRFPLDALWSSPAIDAIGIDAYFPLSDWRDGDQHDDFLLARSIYDQNYLTERLTSGEGFEWYYATDDERADGTRRPITDGDYDKAWMWRAKDIKAWWSNAHYDRVNGLQASTPTSWIPQSKPIWLTEFGCPSVDRGSNGPNAFPDPKSSENALPPFSRGGRDDAIQTRVLDAYYARFDPQNSAFVDADNPHSSLYNGRMIDPANMAVWAFDARPFAAFPNLSTVWADANNYAYGHWLNGRFEGLPLDRLVAAILDDFGIQADEIAIDGFLDGYVLNEPTSARAALEPLATLYRFDCLATQSLRFLSLDPRFATAITQDDALPDKNGALVTLIRAQESELPREIRIGYCDGDHEYRTAVAASRRLAGASRRETTSAPAVVTTLAEAQRIANAMLHDVWAARDHATLSVRPGLLALEPGDLITLDDVGHSGMWRIERITDRGVARDIEAHALALEARDAPAPKISQSAFAAPVLTGRPQCVVVDLPVIKGDVPVLQALAAHVQPWPGGLSVWRSSDGRDWRFFATIDRPAILGFTTTPLWPGSTLGWDDKNRISVLLGSGTISSLGEDAALAGQSLIALQGDDGQWEAIGFAHAELVGPSTWSLSRLLRGLGASDRLATRLLPAGARAVILDTRLLALAEGADALGAHYFWRVVPQGRDYMHPTAAAFETNAGSLLLKPFAPIHVTARRQSNGIVIRFFRRGRYNADSWTPPDVPLDQSREAYEIEILRNELVLRTLAVTTTEALYAASDEMTDFGTRQTFLRMRLYQLGDAIGRGFAADVTLPLF